MASDDLRFAARPGASLHRVAGEARERAKGHRMRYVFNYCSVSSIYLVHVCVSVQFLES
jgi:hypothetical protein